MTVVDTNKRSEATLFGRLPRFFCIFGFFR